MHYKKDRSNYGLFFMPASYTQRQHMILGQLMTNEVLDPAILDAMREVPREPFLPEKLRGAAYVDEDMEIAPGRYMMAPLTFARLLDMAKVTRRCRALVVGTLTGYPAAVIARLAGKVTATENEAGFISAAQAQIQRLGI